MRPSGIEQKHGGSAADCSDGLTGLFHRPENTAAKAGETMDFIALEQMPAEFGQAEPRLRRGPARRISAFRRRSGCVPAEPYPPLKQGQFEQAQGGFEV